MNRSLSFKGTLAVFCVFPVAGALAAPSGIYVRLGSTNKTSASIVIHVASPALVTLSLEVIAKPSPRATVARTGTLNHQSLAVANGLARYEEHESGTAACALVFKLESKRIQVSQSGLCAEFGVGIDATGTYTLRKVKP